MKQSSTNTSHTNEAGLNRKSSGTNENYLYTLLFAGKITLKEYLQQVYSKTVPAH